jgi:hypothetical protein
VAARRIERKHHVGWHTIIKTLASADPPERKKLHRELTALNALHGRIDAILRANPEITTAAIWQIKTSTPSPSHTPPSVPMCASGSQRTPRLAASRGRHPALLILSGDPRLS